MRNTFGQLFTLTTFGESHGPAMGGVLDGMPAGVDIDLDALQRFLHAVLCESIHPGTIFLLDKEGIGILIELRQIVNKGRFTADKPSSGNRICAVFLNKGFAHRTGSCNQRI